MRKLAQFGNPHRANAAPLEFKAQPACERRGREEDVRGRNCKIDFDQGADSRDLGQQANDLSGAVRAMLGYQHRFTALQGTAARHHVRCETRFRCSSQMIVQVRRTEERQRGGARDGIDEDTRQIQISTSVAKPFASDHDAEARLGNRCKSGTEAVEKHGRGARLRIDAVEDGMHDDLGHARPGCEGCGLYKGAPVPMDTRLGKQADDM